MSARDLAHAVGQGQITPQEVAAAIRAVAQAKNPALNAICLFNPAFEAEAEAVAIRLAAGEILPLAGVPVLIKDNIWVKGLRITQGSKLFETFIAPEDAQAVTLLRQAGAMVLGISTCSEFACKGATFSPLHGITRNPVDLRLTPGGSSGGAVAAVAAGIVPLALGTDAGGSSRRPPAHVGIVGMKPTLDLVPYGPGFEEPVCDVSVVCPIARDMGDIALAMEVLTGVTPTAPSEIRLAASPEFGTGQALEPDVLRNFNLAMERVRASGGTIVDAQIDWPENTSGTDILPLQWAGLAHLYESEWEKTPELFDPDLATQLSAGMALTGAEVAAAHQAGHRMRKTLCAALARYGVIATPTTPCPAWAADQLAPILIAGQPTNPRSHAAFTPQANHAGVPALSIPCGTDSNGLPLGLQLIAGAGCDAELMGLAMALEPILKDLG
ncbi:amidase [Puniceibacterium confluentis]|uniref:amidase n=1 Tax=Puniceibacterium confluentis TaxID=1958944 RepID=UPI0011B7E07F|nr:amidase [Puniceibacterium confluentis]